MRGKDDPFLQKRVSFPCEKFRKVSCMKKFLICGYVAGSLDKVTADDAGKLDVINIAFGTIKDGLLFYPRTEETAANIARLKNDNSELKFLLSIGGWGAGGFSTMCKTPEGIAAFTASCMEKAGAMKLDGIDVDWEYPTIGSAGIDYAPEDRENFTALLASLRKALGDEKMLTIAAGAGKYFVDATEIPKIVPLLDYISLMTYDLAGAWTPACHHTALYDSDVGNPSLDSTVKLFSGAGVPKEKLVAGAAFYSRRWTHIKAGENNGFGQKCYDPEDKESGFWGPGYDKILNEYIPSPEWTLSRDEKAHARWLYKASNEEFLSFDDEESCAEKAAYAVNEGLLGIMYWEHGSDSTKKLLAALNKGAGR